MVKTAVAVVIGLVVEIERIALEDEYFIVEMFPVLFAIPRTSGWLAQWEMLSDKETKIVRPRQVYMGYDKRDYVPIEERE